MRVSHPKLQVLGQAKSDGRSATETIRDLLRAEGFAGLYIGMGAQIITAALKAGLLLAAKDQINYLVTPVVKALLALAGSKKVQQRAHSS